MNRIKHDIFDDEAKFVHSHGWLNVFELDMNFDECEMPPNACTYDYGSDKDFQQ